MNALLSLLILAQPYRVESRFEQVLPEPPLGKLMHRSPGQTRAIVLLHGLHLHPFSKANVAKPILRDWQDADSKLVKDLSRLGDVFAFAYAQEHPVENVVTADGATMPAASRITSPDRSNRCRMPRPAGATRMP